MAMSELNTLSVVIPTVNEARFIGDLCRYLRDLKERDLRIGEIIVVDGSSQDATATIAGNCGAVVVQSDIASRAIQMNIGARNATGDVLYFLHADVRPPESFSENIFRALHAGADFGCFSIQFDHPSKLLKINSRLTRKDSKYLGGGDQTLFIKRTIFNELAGFNEDHLIMEDFEFFWRAKKSFQHRIILNDVCVSARKYDKNSYWRVQFANFLIFNGYQLGVSQQRLVNWYQFILDL